MKRAILVILICIPFVVTKVDAGGKKYVTFATQNGTLFFVRPMTMSRNEGCSAAKHLVFDITYLESDKDSVSFTSTIVTNNSESIDSVRIYLSNGMVLSTKTMPLYIEPSKSRNVMRVRFYLKWEQWKMLYSQNEPFTLDYGNHLLFSHNKKKWDKVKVSMNNIINLIEQNENLK